MAQQQQATKSVAQGQGSDSRKGKGSAQPHLPLLPSPHEPPANYHPPPYQQTTAAASPNACLLCGRRTPLHRLRRGATASLQRLDAPALVAGAGSGART